MTDLSPAAQAVKAAAVDAYWLFHLGQAVALLRAAVDQVVPEERKECGCFTNEAIRLNRMGVRAEFLAIAAELEGLT
jgi:hypothetical protein